MKPIPTELVFLSARRTPFGTYGGSLKEVSATDLGVHAAKAAIAQAGVKPEDIDNVVFGNVVQTSSDAIYLARHIGLKAGIPQHVPALTVNRLCGSGFQAVVDAALEMLAGHSECALVGGTESMSQAPHVARGLRFGVGLGKAPKLEDSLWEALTDSYTGLPMEGSRRVQRAEPEAFRGCAGGRASLGGDRADGAAREEGRHRELRARRA